MKEGQIEKDRKQLQAWNIAWNLQCQLLLFSGRTCSEWIWLVFDFKYDLLKMLKWLLTDFKTLIADADEQSAVIVHWGNCTTMLITMWYVSAINGPRKPGVAKFWMDWRNHSEKVTVVCHERKSSSIPKRLCPFKWSGRAKHNKQTLLSFFTIVNVERSRATSSLNWQEENLPWKIMRVFSRAKEAVIPPFLLRTDCTLIIYVQNTSCLLQQLVLQRKN